MKKSVFILVLGLSMTIPAISQGGLLSKVKNSVSRDLSVNSGEAAGKESKPGPEPSCACSDALLIIDLGRFKIDYKEIAVSMKDDGSILVKDRISGKFYIAKNGVTEGPYSEGDSRLKGFDPVSSDSKEEADSDDWLNNYPGFISKSADKYLFKINGKTYGPFAQINDFAVSKSKTKFAAIVIENMPMTEDQGKQMEEAIKKAKTDQERMEIAMKYSQQMQQRMMQGGGPGSMQPKIISNIPGIEGDASKFMGGVLNTNIKYDDILFVGPDRILDLYGKQVLTVDQFNSGYENLFVNSNNKLWASYYSGTLTFSDKKILSELFNPYLTKSEGKVFLTYMYYSPTRNALMQCKMPF